MSLSILSILPPRISIDKPGIESDVQAPGLPYECALSRPPCRVSVRPIVTFAPHPVPATRQVLPPQPEEVTPLPPPVTRQALPPEPEDITPISMPATRQVLPSQPEEATPLPPPVTRQALPPEPEDITPISMVATRLVPPPEPEEIRPLIRRQGLLGRLFALLFCGGAPAAKKLCLAETVALGEKRFVAIIHAEGHKYLIGGGSSGVALLTQLDDSATLAKSFQSLKGAIEATG